MRLRGWEAGGGDRGTRETTERVRQMVDGIESAITSGNDFQLARFLGPPALGHLLRQVAASRAAGQEWLPARSGLQWRRSERSATEPGRFWLRLRFDDRTEVRFGGESVHAAMLGHELDVELDTTAAAWRLCRAEEVYLD
ncbi:MAG TPA: hypothetical protein VNH20_00865 [Candidatus Dormibacteraeota bacterium]|nr:hypothetical protein [Candidatus Dormibacteraeota bacterium]